MAKKIYATTTVVIDGKTYNRGDILPPMDEIRDRKTAEMYSDTGLTSRSFKEPRVEEQEAPEVEEVMPAVEEAAAPKAEVQEEVKTEVQGEAREEQTPEEAEEDVEEEVLGS